MPEEQAVHSSLSTIPSFPFSPFFRIQTAYMHTLNIHTHS